jgi:YD repeat-containing protein
VVEKWLPGGEYDVFYSYDLLGRLTPAARCPRTSTYSYDALSRLLSETGPLGTVSYQYDAAGRRTRLAHPAGGLTIGYDYLVTGEVSALRENPDGANVLLGSYAYDGTGRRTSLTRSNGMSRPTVTMSLRG